jgi:hypothetical protein
MKLGARAASGREGSIDMMDNPRGGDGLADNQGSVNHQPASPPDVVPALIAAAGERTLCWCSSPQARVGVEYDGGAARSSTRSHDAAGRNAGEFVGAAVVVGGERVAIRAGWAAFDRPLMVAGVEGSVLPGPVVGHRAFDAKTLSYIATAAPSDFLCYKLGA